MERIYFDNAATTYPKPDRVAEAVYSYIKNNGMNVGRGAYTSAFRAAEAVYETRELLCGLFGFDKPSNVVFTANVTEALNIVIKGFLAGRPCACVVSGAQLRNASAYTDGR